MIKALSHEIKKNLQDLGIRPDHSEGEEDAKWALIDYGDVVVHIFYQDIRSFYNLEWLWNDATRLKLNEYHKTTHRCARTVS